MSTEKLTQCARNVLDAWSETGWNVGFDAAMRAMREALAGHEALAAVPRPITEAMHVAACKVLTRASGLDGTPQRMLDAMLAAAPQPQQAGVALAVPAGFSLRRQEDGRIVVKAPIGWCIVENTGQASGIDGMILWSLADAMLAATPPQPTAPATQPEPLHLGACITDGKLHATVMRREANGYIAVVAAAEIDEVSLRAGDCHALMTAPAPQAQAVSQWLPIESAPKNGTEILVWWAHPTKDQPGVSLSHWLDNSKTATPWAGWALPKVIVPGMYVSHWMHKPGCPASAAQKAET